MLESKNMYSSKILILVNLYLGEKMKNIFLIILVANIVYGKLKILHKKDGVELL